jgi:hypothetical protein
MTVRRFRVEWVVDCEIALDEEVISRVDDEWRSALYDLKNPNEVAEHIAYNLVMHNTRLSQLDGWADMSDTQAILISDGIAEMSCEEIGTLK